MYLNNENCKFYSDALKHIQNCKDDFWKIDNHLDQYLLEINKSKSIRTLYSKYGSSNFGNLSYLRFCYAKELETKIENDLMSMFSSEYKSKRSKFTFYKDEPKIGYENPKEKHDCLKYISHPEYWNVWNFRIQLDGGNMKFHEKFWERLSEYLKSL